MEERKISPLFKIVKGIVRLCYVKMEIEGMENLPDEPCVVVGNHTQMNGPIACELYLPDDYFIWCAGQMMQWKEVPGYAYEDFWAQKPKYLRPFFKLAAYLITPLSVLVFNNARTIPVYRDSRIVGTFKQTVRTLQDGRSVVIFPERDEKCNNIIYQFEDKFIDTARFYYKKTGREISFVPMYIAPKLKKMYVGKPIRFRADVPIEEERQRICRYLMADITETARSLPRHTVVPYRNIPKKFYPVNTLNEVTQHETAGG